MVDSDGTDSVAPPPWYDDLDGTLAEAWRLIYRGVEDRRADAHTPALSTMGLDGAPQARTVVLRAADPSRRVVTFHTDVRSAKVKELEQNPQCSMLFYERRSKAQVRLLGQAIIHSTGATAASAWERTRSLSRVCYQVTTAPGHEIAAPTAAAFDAAATMDGRENFVCAEIEASELEWLFLHHAGHRRVRFRWIENAWHKSWLAP